MRGLGERRMSRWRFVTRPWVGPICILLAGVAMLSWSWLKWPDPVVDFGGELYIAWRLAEGQTLYGDIAYYKGPLSPYLNSIWFQWFGVSLRTLAVCNILILAGIVWLLYRVLSQASNRFAATAACLVFITVFGFGQYVESGNYNYVCPYSHDMTHGMALSLLAISGLIQYQRRRSLMAMAAIGLVLGLVFLTKAEMFVPIVLAIVTGLTLSLWMEQASRRRLLACAATFVVALLIPPATAFALLSFRLPAAEAVRGTLGSWPWTYSVASHAGPYYLEGMGLVNPWRSLGGVVVWIGWYALVFGTLAALGRACRNTPFNRVGVALAVFLVVVAVLGDRLEVGPWPLDAPKALPAMMLFAGMLSFVSFFRERHSVQTGAVWILRLTLAIFAGVLLGKMAFNTRVYHYGFVLAMPATLVSVVGLLCWIPAWLERRSMCGNIFRAGAAAVLLVFAYAHLDRSRQFFNSKNYQVASGADAFFADKRGAIINAAANEIQARVKPTEKLAVLPGGEMLNYLSRRVNSTRYPHELTSIAFGVFGEDAILDSFQLNPPEYIAVVRRETSDLGAKFFGTDYGLQLYHWMQKNYRTVALIGNPPAILLAQREISNSSESSDGL